IDFMEVDGGGITNGYTPKKINSERAFITETGLYQLIFGSRLSKAREFQKWVFSEVLPSIRKNNYYIDDKYVTRVQYDRLKDTVLLFCENGKIGLPTASEKIFGDKRELNKRLILAKKINRDTCWYDSEWRCADGDNKYPIFVCDTKGKYSDGEVNNTLQVSLTNHGFVYLREFFNKHPLAWSSELQQKIF
ncbi:MAG: BRO-N domain-containing protein, partial [Cetobacterium sp.]